MISSQERPSTLAADRSKKQGASFIKEIPGPVWLGVLGSVAVLGLSAFLKLDSPFSWLFLLALVAAVTLVSLRFWLEATSIQLVPFLLRLPWLLPILALTASALFLRQIERSFLVLPGLLVAGLLLIAVLLGEARAHGPFAPSAFVAKLLLSLASYVIAFSFFVALRRLLPEPPLMALATGVVSGALALQFLRDEGTPLRRRGIYAGVVGLVLGEIAWGLRYWPLESVEAGLVLLLLYYLVAGIAQSHVMQKLTRTVAAEFAAVGLVGLFFLYGSHLWLR